MSTPLSCPSSPSCDTCAPSSQSLTSFWRSGLGFVHFFYCFWSLCSQKKKTEKLFRFWFHWCFFYIVVWLYLDRDFIDFWSFCLHPPPKLIFSCVFLCYLFGFGLIFGRVWMFCFDCDSWYCVCKLHVGNGNDRVTIFWTCVWKSVRWKVLIVAVEWAKTDHHSDRDYS